MDVEYDDLFCRGLDRAIEIVKRGGRDGKDLGYWIKLVDAEVVGNIFDNPELLEEEGN